MKPIAAPHQPRPIRFLRFEPLEGWRLKIYGIATAGQTVRPELVTASLELAAAVLPKPAIADDRYGTGFVIAHDAATVCFALIYWWQSSNELHQRAYFSPRDNPRALTKLTDPAAGCVWELEVIDFERRAWLKDVLTTGNAEGIESYLTRQYNGDV
jgi:hypothetical protein